MNKLIYLFLLCTIFNIDAQTQGSYIKNRWNVKAGHSAYKANQPIRNQPDHSNYSLELNYGILNEIELGICAGYSKLKTIELGPMSGSFRIYELKALQYGFNLNYQMLPSIIKADDFRFDLYLTGKLGGMHIYSPTGSEFTGSYFVYSAGGGSAFYLFKHIGAFLEYAYGKYYKNENGSFSYGLSLKF